MLWGLLIFLTCTAVAQNTQAEFSVTSTAEGAQVVLHNLAGIYAGPTLAFSDFPFEDLQAISAELLGVPAEKVTDVAQVWSNGYISQSITLYPLNEEELATARSLIVIYVQDRTVMVNAYKEIMENKYLKPYECVDGTWSNTGIVPCVYCWDCVAPSTEAQQCTLTSDVVCTSPCQFGTWSSSGYEPCTPWGVCSGGLIETPGSSTSDIDCVETCVAGVSFSDDGLPPCQSCAECGNGVGSDCLINQDAVCSDECATGFWSLTGRGPCQACTTCNAPTDPYRRQCDQYNDAECQSQCEAGKTWSLTGTAPCQPCDGCEEWEDCFAVCLPTRNTQCSPKPCVDTKAWSVTGYEPCADCSECDGKVCASCVADRDTVCDGAQEPCGSGKTWSPSGYSPCTPCTEEWECGPRGCFSSCIPTRDTVCNDHCVEQETWSTTGREPCSDCKTEEDCGFHGSYSSCIPTRDTVCYPDCEDGVSWSWTGGAPCAACRSDCPEGEKLKQACDSENDIVCSGDLCQAGTCNSGEFCDLRYGLAVVSLEGVCIPCEARPSCLDWTLSLDGFARCKDVCEPTPTAKPTTTTTKTPTTQEPVPCPEGGWSKDGNKPCNVCTECGSVGEAKACTSESDTVCNVACEPGTWSETGVQPCMACSTCVADAFYISSCSLTADAVCNDNDCADSLVSTGGKWHDPLGDSYDCSWYAQRDHCTTFGATAYNYGMNANDACCACGGGQTRPPTMGSTETPTPQPTDHFMSQVCECAGAYPGLCSAYAGALALVDDVDCSSLDQTAVSELLGGKTFGEYCPNCPQGRCVDVVPVGETKWYDSSVDNCDCAWYDASDKNCALYGTSYESFGYTATEACCSCGGGITNTPTMAPVTPTPTHHPTEPVVANEDCSVLRVSGSSVADLNGDYSVITWDANAGRPAWSKSGGNNNVDIIHPVYGKGNTWQLGLDGFVGDIYYTTIDGDASLYPVSNGELSGTSSWALQGSTIVVETTITCLSETTTTEVETEAPVTTTTTTTTEAPTCDEQIAYAVQENTFELLNQISIAEDAVASCESTVANCQSSLDACCTGDEETDVVTDSTDSESSTGITSLTGAACVTVASDGFVWSGLPEDVCIVEGTNGQQEIAVVVGDNVYPTCIAYSEDMEGACPTDSHYCSGSGNTYGYRGNVLSSLNEARTRSNYKHPACPTYAGVCDTFSNYWTGTIFPDAGISETHVSNLCHTSDGLVNVVTIDGLVSTCVGFAEVAQAQCTMKNFICSGFANGYMVYGWPGSIGATVRVALEQESLEHPQCPFTSVA